MRPSSARLRLVAREPLLAGARRPVAFLCAATAGSGAFRHLRVVGHTFAEPGATLTNLRAMLAVFVATGPHCLDALVAMLGALHAKVNPVVHSHGGAVVGAGAALGGAVGAGVDTSLKLFGYHVFLLPLGRRPVVVRARSLAFQVARRVSFLLAPRPVGGEGHG